MKYSIIYFTFKNAPFFPSNKSVRCLTAAITLVSLSHVLLGIDFNSSTYIKLITTYLITNKIRK